MTPEATLAIAGFIISAMFGLLATVLGWIGNKVYGKLDEVVKAVGSVKDELHTRITDTDRRQTTALIEIDRRVSKIEAVCTTQHKS